MIKFPLCSKTLAFCLVVFALLSFGSESDAASSKPTLIRIRFAGVSQFSRKELAANDNIDTFTSTQSYDAVWEQTVYGDDFPSIFSRPTILNESGTSSKTFKNGLGNCSANLSFFEESRLPSVEPYNFNGDMVTIRIPTPHRSRMGDPNGACNPAISYFANADKNDSITYNFTNGGTVKTTITPSIAGLPPEPGTTTPISKGDFAVFQVNKNMPSTSMSFTFEQNTDLTYTKSSIKWKGWVTVEVNPTGAATPSNPTILIDKDPPFVGPLNQPTNATEEPAKIPSFIEAMFNNIVSVIKVQSSEPQNASFALDSNGNLNITVVPRSVSIYKLSKHQIAYTSDSAPPVNGTMSTTFSVKNAGDSKATVTTLKSVNLKLGVNSPIIFNLPSKLATAIKKGLASKVSITTVVQPKKKGSKPVRKSTSFSLKKRK